MAAPRVFVSHSHKDDAFTTRLVADLRAAGAEVWVDTADMHYGDFVDRINDALVRSEWLVLVLTPDALMSPYVKREVNAAINRLDQGQMSAVIPILAAACDRATIPPLWANPHRYDATSDYQRALRGVTSALGLGVETPQSTHGGSLYIPRALQTTYNNAQGLELPFDNSQIRRLPVYLLLNCSGSMAGTKIVQVNTGMQLLYQELLADPRSANTVYISIIPFADTAYQMDLVPIGSFSPPQLSANGGSALGAALGLLNESLDQDIIPNVPGQKGDYKPLVMLLTDSTPTDSWQGEAQRLATRTVNKAQNIVALAIGYDVDLGVLYQITPSVLRIDTVTADVLRAFFQWMSASIKTASQAAAQVGGSGIQAPPLPNGIVFDCNTCWASFACRKTRAMLESCYAQHFRLPVQEASTER